MIQQMQQTAQTKTEPQPELPPAFRRVVNERDAEYTHIPGIGWLFKVGPISKLLRECELAEMSTDDFRAWLEDMTVLPEPKPFDAIEHEQRRKRPRHIVTGHFR